MVAGREDKSIKPIPQADGSINPCDRAAEGKVKTAAMLVDTLPNSREELIANYRQVKELAREITPEVGEAICLYLSQGWTMKELCGKLDIPLSTLHGWAMGDGGETYMHARGLQAMAWAEELLTIADDARNDWMERNDPDNPGWQANHEHINRSKLRIDTRRFLLAKMLPKVYGDAAAGGKGSTSFVFNFPANATPAQMQAVANLAKSGMTPQALPAAPAPIIDSAARPKV